MDALTRARTLHVIRYWPGCGPPINEPARWCVWKPGDYYRPGYGFHVAHHASTWREAMEWVDLNA